MHWKSWLRRLQWIFRRGEERPAAPAVPGPEPCRPSRMEVGWATDVGRQRSLNEDAVLVIEAWQEGHYSMPPVGLFLLADGMGGHLSGEIASALAVRTAARHILQHLWATLSDQQHSADEPSLQEVLTDAFRRAHEAVTGRVPGGGTTLLCALLLGDRAYIANVGDSRAYLVSPQGCRQITRDHSVVDMMVELGQMTAEEAARHPQRNVLYRAVGQRGMLEVDTFICTLSPGEVLLLCSDGLWETVGGAEIARVITASASLQEACDILVEKANQAGGRDNISVILAAPGREGSVASGV